MRPVGIEAMNVFGGSAYVDVRELMEHRQLDTSRFEQLLMSRKTVALPSEDPVTFGVNAARPILDALSDAERNRIELLISCTESGIDFGKSVGSYLHEWLGLNRNCRIFEVKNACYAGTAGLQMAVNFVLSQVSPGAKALVVATDVSRYTVDDGGDSLTMDWAFVEPSSGAGAAAMLVSEMPEVFQLDVGANGYYGYEVMDTCRPTPDGEAGDSDLGLLSYLDCCEQTFQEYRRRIPDADYHTSFDYLAFHTPFGGMVRGAHRTMMRKLKKAKAADIESDFERRVRPGIRYAQHTGNIMGGSVFSSLAGIIDHGSFDTPKRIGCFSYGSGCCAEFYSGVVSRTGSDRLRGLGIEEQLGARRRLTMDQYEAALQANDGVRFGTRNVKIEGADEAARSGSGESSERLVLEEIREFHREYRWVA
ncbi:hydroxymethylglutaryl-CoA synthase family protein [Streptomyces prunicolor]|uniref:hydroxymethylglutaryl-CoA synthase family protein n=1 Tax=Streptomyces prunicolor TaxID=67348 RepID=UPI0003A08A11|nr:hydroxymethylglutaryl-CoA synthase family protein [Streptomyces prunicolor]